MSEVLYFLLVHCFTATTKKETSVQVVRVALAVGSAVLLVTTGMEYLKAIDGQVSNRQKPSLP